MDHFYDGTDFGLPSGSYSVVFTSEVIEHSFEPEALLKESYRVLRPGGVILLSIPFLWPEHEQPNDSQRFTSFGLSKRLEDVGFSVLWMTKTNPGIVAMFQLTIELFERVVRKGLLHVSPGPARFIAQQIARVLLAPVWFAVNATGWALRNLIKMSEPELYLNLVVLAVKPSGERV